MFTKHVVIDHPLLAEPGPILGIGRDKGINSASPSLSMETCVTIRPQRKQPDSSQKAASNLEQFAHTPSIHARAAGYPENSPNALKDSFR